MLQQAGAIATCCDQQSRQLLNDAFFCCWEARCGTGLSCWGALLWRALQLGWASHCTWHLTALEAARQNLSMRVRA